MTIEFPVENPPFDLPHAFDMSLIEKQAENLLVTDETSATNALYYALQSRKIKHHVEDTRKEITRPHLDFQRAVNKFAKEISAKMEEMEERLQEKITDWMIENKENPFISMDSIKCEDGSISLKTTYKATVTDIDLVPRQYLIINQQWLDEAVKAGIRNIAGIKIEKVETTQLRVNNQ